jgi:hypothetical protein
MEISRLRAENAWLKMANEVAERQQIAAADSRHSRDQGGLRLAAHLPGELKGRGIPASKGRVKRLMRVWN